MHRHRTLSDSYVGTRPTTLEQDTDQRDVVLVCFTLDPTGTVGRTLTLTGPRRGTESREYHFVRHQRQKPPPLVVTTSVYNSRLSLTGDVWSHKSRYFTRVTIIGKVSHHSLLNDIHPFQNLVTYCILLVFILKELIKTKIRPSDLICKVHFAPKKYPVFGNQIKYLIKPV